MSLTDNFTEKGEGIFTIISVHVIRVADHATSIIRVKVHVHVAHPGLILKRSKTIPPLQTSAAICNVVAIHTIVVD